jgi:ABC-type sugar transport system substrate-binding protein
MDGFVIQDPFGMAALALETLVDHILGTPVPPRVDTGVLVVNSENLDSEEAQRLLHPPLEVFLPSGE